MPATLLHRPRSFVVQVGEGLAWAAPDTMAASGGGPGGRPGGGPGGGTVRNGTAPPRCGKPAAPPRLGGRAFTAWGGAGSGSAASATAGTTAAGAPLAAFPALRSGAPSPVHPSRAAVPPPPARPLQEAPPSRGHAARSASRAAAEAAEAASEPRRRMMARRPAGVVGFGSSPKSGPGAAQAPPPRASRGQLGLATRMSVGRVRLRSCWLGERRVPCDGESSWRSSRCVSSRLTIKSGGSWPLERMYLR
mmetsp:Transcript_90421/g.281516  ORF Transcript_90421/g.281516 Transcript_90421/m.281516 type:complete len:249 (-) Transcript_90421:796-1542(-)